MRAARVRRSSLAWLISLVLLVWVLPAGAVETEPAVAREDESGEPTTESHEEGAHDEASGGHGGHSSRLTDEHIPLQTEIMPERPGLLIEWGNPYLGTGRISPGKELPSGTVWQPTLIFFGTLRSAVQTFDNGSERVTEWANRLDLFGNLQLTGTERLVIGFRNLDRDGQFTSYVFEPDLDDPWVEEVNSDIQAFYFEGDFGEIFPGLDREDFGRKDIGFSIGRQPLLFQEGMLLNDSIDGIGLTRNTLLPTNTSNFRLTFFAGLDNVNRVSFEDESGKLYGLFTSTDKRRSTIDADLVYVTGDELLTGDLVAAGLSFAQRIGRFSTSFRFLGSTALDQETPFAADGGLVFSEISWTPHYTHDHVYLTTFAAFDEFTAAASGPGAGGPLGRAGINFAAVGLGSFGAPLSSRARDVAGGAFGYQKFIGVLRRRQLLVEAGVRVGTADEVADGVALTVRYQMAVGRRVVLVFDGFGASVDSVAPGVEDRTSAGGRFEFRLKF